MSSILTTIFPSPLGDLIACATEQGLCLLEFVGSRRVEREQQDLQRLLKRPMIAGMNEHLAQAEQELREYFAGSLTGYAGGLQRKAWLLQHEQGMQAAFGGLFD